MDANPTPLKIRPGVHLVDSQEASLGRFVEAQWVRFVNGLPEKIGGWEKRTPEQFLSIARGCKAWNTNYGYPRYAFGTAQAFYVSDDDAIAFVDKTPRVTIDYLDDKLSTTNLDNTVTVTHTAHGLATGDRIMLRGASHNLGGMIAGLDINGTYSVTVLDANNYTFDHADTANATLALGGGRVFYVYSTTDPFETTSGDNTVVVNKNSHGLEVGQRVYINGGSAVAGLTFDGVYTVLTASANEFTVDHASNAGSTTTGGGETIIEGLLREGSTSAGGSGGSGGVYGSGIYGVGFYGIAAGGEIDPIYIEPRFWSIDNYGEDLVLCPLGGLLYYYDTSRGGVPTPVLEAFSSIRFIFVTDEKIVHALGINGDPTKFGWSDQADLTEWVATDINQASAGRDVQGGSRLLGGCKVANGVNLLFTDTTVYVHQYTGGALVYDTRIAPDGNDNGLIGPLSFASLNGKVFWMSQNGFRMFDGAVRDIPQSEDIEDYVYSRLNQAQIIKIAAFSSPLKSEIWFTFPINVDGEPRRYAAVALADFSWSYGDLDRTCGCYFDTQGSEPIWFGLDGYVYTHETGQDADGEALPWVLTYAAFGDGAMFMSIPSFDPDFQRDVGEITFAFSAYDTDPAMVTDTDVLVYDSTVDGAALQPRIDGRFIRLRMSGGVELGDDFRLGVPKVAIKKTGRRRG